MILIAPDKYKGTLSAARAAAVIADAITEATGRHDLIKAPMADGGEDTAAIIRGTGRLPGMTAAQCRWEEHPMYSVETRTRTAVIDSSAVIGLQLVPPDKRDILRATSLPLGVKVREILKGGCRRVLIGVGGTATCDGGMGFLEGLGMERLGDYRDSIVGLCDVQVPLVAPPGQPSALMFAPQKGATEADMSILRERLEHVRRTTHGHPTPYDGAGGGLGYAIGGVIGAECRSGAEYVLECYGIDWSRVSLVITGEGRIDSQTSQGKVVHAVSAAARRNGIEVVAFGGTVEHGLKDRATISTADYLPGLPLDSKAAALRLRAAVMDYCASRGLGSSG